MKTLIAATALTLVSTATLAASFEDRFQNPDLNTGVYDRPVTLMERSPVGNVPVSLDDLYRGNPDGYHGQPVEARDDTMPAAERTTSLDEFAAGNPDHV